MRSGKLNVAARPQMRNRNFKATDEEWALINALAHEYADGNVSAWIRYAAINHSPGQATPPTTKQRRRTR